MWFNNPQGERASKYARSLMDAAENADKEAVSASKAMDSNLADELLQPASEKEVEGALEGVERRPNETLEDFIRRTCVWCERNERCQEDREVLEYLVRSPGIWLHALSYSVGDTSFSTELPEWSQI